MAEEVTITAQTSLSDGSDGVAPHSGPSPVATSKKLTCDWLAEHKNGWQLGEQGLLDAIIDAINGDIPDEHRWCVEFGAGNGAETPVTCDRIIRRPGWSGLLIEGDKDKQQQLRSLTPSSAVIVNGLVTLHPGSTIDDHMARAGCPASPALMVIDIDGADYYIATNMKARPYVLCIEHLDMYCPQYNDEAFVPHPNDVGKTFQSPPVPGLFNLSANTKALDIAIPPLGYTLVARTRFNSLYVRNDVVKNVARKPDGKLRINVGAGSHNDPRYVPLDIKTGTDARKLPYEDATVDELYCAHLLEHFSFYETDLILAEFARVLKPGGLMRIAVPDAKKLAEMMLACDESGDHREVEMTVYGAHSDATNIHHAMFTEQSLRERMNNAGIGSVSRFAPFVTDDCSNHKCSLNLQGIKRHWPKIETPTVTLVLSQPRLTFTGHEIRLLELARELKFQVQPCTGAFWDRDMTVATQAAIEKTNPDFLMYSDYDSVFEVADVQKMLDTINSDPTMAAIGAVQMSRHNDQPLVFEQHRDYSGAVSRVDFQHFGLMIIRREVFEELPHPWFWSIPGKNDKGEWDWDVWNRTDADITFWRNVRSLGFRVFQHNEVCIGHIVQCIKYPRNSGRGVQLIPIENYWKNGKPKDATFNPAIYRTKPAEFVPVAINAAATAQPEGSTCHADKP